MSNRQVSTCRLVMAKSAVSIITLSELDICNVNFTSYVMQDLLSYTGKIHSWNDRWGTVID